MIVSGFCFATVHITCEIFFIILFVYNPPRNSNYLWPSTLFRSLLSTHFSVHPMVPIILAGEINLSTVNWDEMSSINYYEQECFDFFLGLNLTQSNKTNYRILDVCLSNSPSLIVSVITYSSPILDDSPKSDHEPLFMHTLMSNGSHRTTRRCLFNFKKMDKESILKALTEDPCIPYYWTNPSLMVQHWHEWLEPKLDTFVHRKNSHRTSLPQLIRPTPSNVIRWLKTAENRAEKGIITENQKHKVAQLKTDVERMSEEDLSEYPDKLFARRSTEKTFKHLKRVKGAPILPLVMKLADEKTRTALEKANAFNESIISVYNPRGTCKTENLQHSLVGDFDTSSEKVCVIQRELDNTKATGPDGISPCFLRGCAEGLAQSVSYIFRKETSKLPTCWKISCIKPLHKVGAKDKVAICRPVALLACVGKVFERCFYDKLLKIV